jgi:hypothetical protein
MSVTLLDLLRDNVENYSPLLPDSSLLSGLLQREDRDFVEEDCRLTNAHDDNNSVFEFGIKIIHLLIRILKGRNVGRMRWESPLSGNKRRLAQHVCFGNSGEGRPSP